MEPQTQDQKSREEVTISGLLASGDDIAIRVTHELSRSEIVQACDQALKLVSTDDAGRLLAHMVLVTCLGPMGAGSWLQSWYVNTDHVEPLREFRQMLEAKGLVDPMPGTGGAERITVVVSRSLAKELKREHNMRAEDVVRSLMRVGASGVAERAA
jgi:hypothetical protein